MPTSSEYQLIKGILLDAHHACYTADREPEDQDSSSEQADLSGSESLG
jgi:hypothetical protein